MRDFPNGTMRDELSWIQDLSTWQARSKTLTTTFEVGVCVYDVRIALIKWRILNKDGPAKTSLGCRQVMG
jgi:hypothetical protein